ncbi:replication initiator protein A [Enterococcus sp. ALS3]|uniref:Replication initiator protein A n=1 Tax=Enterococcus alishanensis TaxID=1303817 RepID=A0ABS6TG41_9ENTE|nr:replication initiator protein A [Enterococcus alishanensis]MBV7391843.1 replication initiator protein A [Enterococcus alishanensis]
MARKTVRDGELQNFTPFFNEFQREVSKYFELPLEAKYAYMLMNNRENLSYKNSLYNEKGEVYIHFTNGSLSSQLGVKETRCRSLKKLLLDNQLIEEEAVPGKPSRIFINQFDIYEVDYLWERLTPVDGRDKWVERSLEGLIEGTDYTTMYDFIEYDNRTIKVKFFVAMDTDNEHSIPPRKTSPSSDEGVPPRDTNPNKNLLKNKTLEQPIKATTNATEFQQVLSEQKLPFSFVEGYNRLFLTEETVRLLSLFGDFKVTKRFLDIIFETKKKVENFKDKVYRDKGIYNTLPIYGEIWDQEIEKKVKWLIFKKKEYETKDNPIKNLESYWYRTMEIFWQNVIIMEREEGFMRLDIAATNGELEIRDSVGEIEKMMKLEPVSATEKKMRLFEMIYNSHACVADPLTT